MGCLSLVVITAEEGGIGVSHSRLEAISLVFCMEVRSEVGVQTMRVTPGAGRSSFFVLSDDLKKAILTWIEPGHKLE